MAQLVSTLSTQVSSRARDPLQTGTASADVINLLSFSQQVVNGILCDVTATALLTINPNQVIYQISNYVDTAVRILAIRDASGRDLQPFDDFAGLNQVATNWPSAVSDAPRSYALCGRDLLIFYPGVKTAQTVTVVFGILTFPLILPTDTTEVTNDDDDAVMDLTEVLLLLKAGDLNECAKIIERFKSRIETLKSEPK